MKKNGQTPKASKPPRAPAADKIAQIADNGGDIERFFTRAGEMMPPIQPTPMEPNSAAIYMKYGIVEE
jgi:hypothetical protein